MADTVSSSAPPIADAVAAPATHEAPASPSVTTSLTPPEVAPENNINLVDSPPVSTATHVEPTSTRPVNVLNQERETVISPQVIALRGMFPDFDDLLLESVLESVQWDQDHAVDVLLGMSDPEYKSDSRPPVPAKTQTDLDEDLARRLLLEDQEAAAWQSQREYDSERPPPLPLRSGRPGSPSGKDTMAELSEQFNKFAETGKKTLGNFFSKVKAKMAELDEPRQPSASGSGLARGSGGDTYPYDDHTSPFADPRRPLQQAPSAPITSSRSQGYDVTPIPPTSFGAPSTSPSSQPVIDAGKIGLLPKRPVSLLRGGSSDPVVKTTDNDTDDDLEYTENPFESEGKKY